MKRIYYGGTILTMDGKKTAEAVLTENGRILQTGRKEELLPAAEDAEKTDLDGAVLMPGFIDPHSHYSQMASSLLTVSLDGAANADEIRERIRAFIAGAGKTAGSWVTAGNYDQTILEDRQHLSLQQLDSLCPGYPLFIQHKSGHMGLLNSLAMEKLGITEQTQAPEGGCIGHENGHLNGYLEENAYFTYIKKVPLPEMAELRDAYIRAQKIYASYGITTIQEGMLVSQMLPLYRMLFAEHILRLDLVAYPDRETFAAAYAEFPQAAGRYSDHIRLGGIKIFLDGSPQGRTAWMRTPYLGGAPDDCGYGTMTDDAVCEAFVLAAERKVQLLAHCNGDAAAAQMIRCLIREERQYPVLKELRPVMIHAQLLGTDQIPEAVSAGILASFFVAHVFHWGDVHIRNFGPERAAEISPARSALQMGLPFTFHQDSPVIMPDMLETVWCAVNRRTKAGVVLGEDEKIPVYEALKAVTVSAAYQYFEENEKGTVTPGKKEDFVILDRNPLETAPEELRKIRVLRTVKDGATIWEA